MKRQTKNRAKKLKVIYLSLAGICALIVLSLIYMVLEMKSFTGLKESLPFLFSITIVTIVGFVFNAMYGKYDIIISTYRNKLNDDRDYNHMVRAIDYILKDDFEYAKFIIDECIVDSDREMYTSGLYSGCAINKGGDKLKIIEMEEIKKYKYI